MKKLFITAFIFITAISLAHAQETAIPLYPNGVPNSKPTPADYAETIVRKGWVTNVSIPTLTPYFPEKGKASGTAIIICPGGGYYQLSMDNEGTNIAVAFAKIGITAFVLKYRLPSDLIMVDKTIGPLQDAQQALIMVRTRAAEWGINPAKVGMAGFSAGGHLATTAAAWSNKPVVANLANINLRPDFMVLLYPATTFSNAEHHDSKDHLLGLNPTAEQIELYSSEKHITANTPPTFMVQAEDDPLVTIQSALNFYSALAKANVKAEMHIYPAGGHGFGLINKKSNEHWLDWCISWMNTNGF
ncbi:alpha/beta hydrolase [Mucilaginibacter sp.]|uniref:alpha/beta hydrolase n=1 Tax=Mucilaginibacter sp. TaxID=1882438 RepID=UPI00262ECD6C|nr:alpha/beta hydrolase [Mucilaginibacter sp.]MDB5032565.1 alpha/beta hydrolase [Mucilaginibacter sp.]